MVLLAMLRSLKGAPLALWDEGEGMQEHWAEGEPGVGVSSVQRDPSLHPALWAPGCLIGAQLVWLERPVLWPPRASPGYSPRVPS